MMKGALKSFMLGLAVVKMVVQTHGETVDLKNQETGGLKACITLPQAKP